MAKNIRQEKFIKHYAATGNAYQSALQAGYSQNYAKAQASKLLAKLKPEVKEAAAAEEIKIGLTRADKKAFLLELVKQAEQGVLDPGIAIKAIDIDNKMDGEYMERKQVSIDGKLEFSWADEAEENGED